VEETADFDGFYAAVFARLVGQLAVVTGDPHEAEDVVQEAMARAASRWARVRAYDVPEAWVRRVAFNLAVSGHRRTRRRLAGCCGSGHQRRSRRSRWTRWPWPKPSRS
jgi:RNA polymerase sigma-70 factor (ECF subfamily)